MKILNYPGLMFVCFQEAKAIIAQRSGNPREFFKQKERAMTISVDTSPVSVHRTGKHFKTHLTVYSHVELEIYTVHIYSICTYKTMTVSLEVGTLLVFPSIV